LADLLVDWVVIVEECFLIECFCCGWLVGWLVVWLSGCQDFAIHTPKLPARVILGYIMELISTAYSMSSLYESLTWGWNPGSHLH